MMKISIICFALLMMLTRCDNFEKKFYDKIDSGQIKAAKLGSDTLDLSTITDFEWDSMILVRGNESVPVFKEEIEEILNNRSSDIHWEDRRFSNKVDPKLRFITFDLPTYKDRFYFLTHDKKLIEKEIKSGIYSHIPNFDMKYCLIDSVKERYWLSKKECKFILKTNGTMGNGMVFLYPQCKTRFSPDSIKIWK